MIRYIATVLVTAAICIGSAVYIDVRESARIRSPENAEKIYKEGYWSGYRSGYSAGHEDGMNYKITYGWEK